MYPSYIAGEDQEAEGALAQDSSVLRVLNGFAYTGGSTLAASRALSGADSHSGAARVQVSM
jgi:23S rRNA G2069 N7-methylase RlmK/C1962 C5-methylase RlmI